MRGRHHIDGHGRRVLGAVLRLTAQGIVLVVGTALIVASIALGWLPGPGGIPLFLAGLAVLATQFDWARRVRSWAFGRLRRSAGRARRTTGRVVDDVSGDVAVHDR